MRYYYAYSIPTSPSIIPRRDTPICCQVATAVVSSSITRIIEICDHFYRFYRRLPTTTGHSFSKVIKMRPMHLNAISVVIGKPSALNTLSVSDGLFQLQMRISIKFLHAKDLLTSLLIMITRSFLFSCT